MRPAPWMRWTLIAAGLYNLLWGAAVVIDPEATLRWLGAPDATPFLWQCIGMIVGVFGVGYLIAASNPMRHWPIVFVGLLGKTFGPIGYLAGALRSEVPWQLGWTILTNDLIWIIPFICILLAAWRTHTALRPSSDQFVADHVSA